MSHVYFTPDGTKVLFVGSTSGTGALAFIYLDPATGNQLDATESSNACCAKF